MTPQPLRMNRQFALDILDHLPEGSYASRLAEIAERTITPSIAALNRLVSDNRVVDAELAGGH